MNTSEKQRRFHADLINSYDEEFEMEVDDRFIDGDTVFTDEDRLLRKTYFRELFVCRANSSSCRTGSCIRGTASSCCSKATTPPAKAARSSASRSV